MSADFFPDIDDYNSKLKFYSVYEQLNGDMGNHRNFNFSHGDWIVVGHGLKTNSKCGQFRRFDACLRTELHSQAGLDGVSHVNEAFVHLVHHWCHNYSCPVCFLHGACCREAEHISQRIKFASKGGRDGKGVYHAPLGDPQHIVLSCPVSDYGLAEFEHEKFCVKAKRILNEVGVISYGFCFHGFRFADYSESIEKRVPFGYYWSPHLHVIGFIQGGYGACRHCAETARIVHTRGGKTVTKHGDIRFCASCDGFEKRVRESFEKNRYIISNTDERQSVFATAWYQLSHMAIRRSDSA